MGKELGFVDCKQSLIVDSQSLNRFSFVLTFKIKYEIAIIALSISQPRGQMNFASVELQNDFYRRIKMTFKDLSKPPEFSASSLGVYEVSPGFYSGE